MHPLPPPNRQSSASAVTRTRDLEANVDVRPSSAHPQSSTAVTEPSTEAKKKRKHRGGRKKRNRRQSFAAPSDASTLPELTEGQLGDPLMQVSSGLGAHHSTAYHRRIREDEDIYDDGMDSDALLDHRSHPPIRPRRESRLGFSASYRSGIQSSRSTLHPQEGSGSSRRPQIATRASHVSSGDESEEDTNDRTPLIATTQQHKSPAPEGYGIFKTSPVQRHNSNSSDLSRRDKKGLSRGNSFPNFAQEYDVNNPPSVPVSPDLSADKSYEDVMMMGGDFMQRSIETRRTMASGNKDLLIDVDGDAGAEIDPNSAPPSPRLQPDGMRRRTLTHPGAGDVCFPSEAMSEMAEEDFLPNRQASASTARRRSRRRGWPELWAFEEWSREEKEDRSGAIRAQRIREPMLVGGRLRPSKGGWHRTEEDAPYRYTYFNEEFESTIHAQTISELVQPGGSFRELFIPDPPELSDSETDADEESERINQLITLREKEDSKALLSPKSATGQTSQESRNMSRINSLLSGAKSADGKTSPQDTLGRGSAQGSGVGTPQQDPSAAPKPKKYGPRPTFWLDVACPTEQEMRVLCKAFGIHALTSEDIMMQEAREKVELFRHYYFINYRTFEQDTNSEDYLEPVNLYICVFRHGIVTFHFSQIPHPANVRRRIRQLTDYLILSADWISYAIIDDVTDVYQPLIHAIEVEVDDIDELVLKLFQDTDALSTAPTNSINNEKRSEAGDSDDGKGKGRSGIDLLRRIGETRKKVMSLYRLLGNKADVIKGFAKRCNEQWEVAPKSEIGLYLGDIQDHILTMTSNLSHYETLLSRAHSNYLAQINIRMNERQEQTADVLGKLTVVGTIVLPMNIICGMWGMNVKVPGQDIEDNLYWFCGITAGLILFAIVCFYYCKKIYGIV